MSTPIKPDDNAATPDSKPCPQPSLAEAYFFLNIIKFNKSKLDTEWDKVAEASGFKNAETAKVRFGQIKKKLGFQTGTPIAARVKPGKRSADADEAAAGGPAEKKPRKKTPARSRAKKQPAGSSVPATSPIAPEDESPLAVKTAKKPYQKGGDIHSGLNAKTSYEVSATGNPGDGYAPSTQLTAGTDNGAPATNTYQAAKTIIKPEQLDFDDDDDDDSDDDDEEKQNARAKADLLEQITKEQIRAKRDATVGPTKHQAYDSGAFGPPNNFAHVNMFAPLNAQQVQDTAHRVRTPLPTSARQVRAAAAQQAMSAASQTHGTTASTASLRQVHNGAGHVTTIQARQQALTAAQPVGDHHVAQKVEVEEDMTLPANDNLPQVDDDDQLSAFNAAMYGADRHGSLFQWPSF